MKMKIFKDFINFVEINFCVIVPIYLYGWLKGLLIASALTSLMHIVALLRGDKWAK